VSAANDRDRLGVVASEMVQHALGAAKRAAAMRPVVHRRADQLLTEPSRSKLTSWRLIPDRLYKRQGHSLRPRNRLRAVGASQGVRGWLVARRSSTDGELVPPPD